MIKLDRVVRLCQNNKPHDFTFVAKGQKRAKRKGGYLIKIKQGIVTSSNFANNTVNIEIVQSGEIRKLYTILMLQFDGHKVFY